MRVDLDIILSYVKSKSHVLDLGCGDGTLLAHLRDKKHTQGVGLENDAEKITECIEKNIAVVEQDLNTGLAGFNDASYDLVIMTLALQAMQRPDRVLDEMLRIGKECVVTFPNFGHWKARWH
jgi:methionine biosynthesis protein MetW